MCVVVRARPKKGFLQKKCWCVCVLAGERRKSADLRGRLEGDFLQRELAEGQPQGRVSRTGKQGHGPSNLKTPAHPASEDDNQFEGGSERKWRRERMQPGWGEEKGMRKKRRKAGVKILTQGPENAPVLRKPVHGLFPAG